MRYCDYCLEPCDAQVGFVKEETTRYWGGVKDQSIEHSPRRVAFFCSEKHRNDFLAEGMSALALLKDWEEPE